MKLKTRVPKHHGTATKAASRESTASSSFDQAHRNSQPRPAHDRQVSDKAAGGVTVVYRRIDELRLDPKNPRLHRARQIRQIARSIEAFGFNCPVLVDATLKVIAGHGRVLAARLLGWNEVPTIRLDHLSEAQARAFMIADNRLTEISAWDDQLLAEQLQQLSVLNLDFSLEATGFEMGEIDLRIEGLATSPASSDKADLPAEPQTGPRLVVEATCGCSAITGFTAGARSTQLRMRRSCKTKKLEPSFPIDRTTYGSMAMLVVLARSGTASLRWPPAK